MKKAAGLAAFAALWALCVLSGCAHVPTLREGELQSIAPEQVGVIIPITLTSDDPGPVSGGCTVNLRAPEGVIDYPIELKTGKHLIFAALSEGDYRFHDFFCFGRHWDLTGKEWPNFKVRQGKIGIVDAMDFRLSDTNTLASFARNRKDAQEELAGLFGRLSQAARERAVNAYNGMPITLAMVQEPTHYGEYEILKSETGPKASETEAKKIGRPSFKACYRGEDWVNYLWVGELKLRAHYVEGKLADVVIKENPNTFTPHFGDCVKATLSDFKPKATQTFWYDLTL